MVSSVTQLAISWPHLLTYEQTGGSPVLNYKIRFNQGSLINLWVDIDIIPASSTPNYLIEGLSPGEDYQIAIQAENIHGFSKNSLSNIFTQRAASQPSQPSQVVVKNYNTLIELKWAAPFQNHQSIIGFEVWVRDRRATALQQGEEVFVEVCQGEWLECRI